MKYVMVALLVCVGCALFEPGTPPGDPVIVDNGSGGTNISLDPIETSTGDVSSPAEDLVAAGVATGMIPPHMVPVAVGGAWVLKMLAVAMNRRRGKKKGIIK